MKVHDQRIVERAPFRAENLAARACLQRVGRESVNRLGRNGDDLASAQAARQKFQVSGGAPVDADVCFCHGTKKAGERLRP